MNKLSVFFIIPFVFAISCTQPLSSSKDKNVSTTVTATKYVKNSRWDTVRIANVIVSENAVANVSEIASTETELLNWIENYNAITTDDQYFVATTDIPADSAPAAHVWIVKAITYERIVGFDDLIVDRSLVDGRYDAWERDALNNGGILYIDNEPPAYTPAPIDTRTDYEKYAIYEVNSDGSIYFETHCEDYDPETMLAKKDVYYQQRLYGIQFEVYGTTKRIVTGSIYTPPTKHS
jgi:hypothetical protein